MRLTQPRFGPKIPAMANLRRTPNAALMLAALATSDDDDDDDHSPGSGNPPDLHVSEPLAPVIFAGREAWVTKARPAGQIVQCPPCAVPQTGPPPAHATA